jgi:hypothetical protein
MSGETEKTDAGVQRLVRGVAPVTLGQRLAALARRPMRPKRNPYAEQKPCDLGLFDEVGRAQTDLLDLINAAKKEA